MKRPAVAPAKESVDRTNGACRLSLPLQETYSHEHSQMSPASPIFPLLFLLLLCCWFFHQLADPSSFLLEDQSLKLFSAATGASWWIDAYSDQLRVKDGSLDPRKNWCVCYDKMPLYACACSSSHMLLMQGGLLQGGQQCASANATGALDFTACPQSQLRSNVECLGLASIIELDTAIKGTTPTIGWG